MVVVSLISLVLPQSQGAVVGWWSFDDSSQGVALDESANGNHLTLGGASFTVPGEGIAGRALDFVEDTDLPITNSTVGLRVTRSFTIELWVKPTPDISSYAVNRFVTYGGERYVFRILDGKLHGYVWEEGVGYPNGLRHVYGSTRVPTNAWSHVAFTYDGNEMKLYLNGELDGSAACSCSIDQGGGTDLRLSNGPLEPFFGLMDELHILDEALEQQELGFYTGVVAYAGPAQTVFSGETATLDGRGSSRAKAYAWEQVVDGDEPEVTLLETGTAGVVTFTAPSLRVGTVLTFRLTVSGPGGTDSDLAQVTIRAKNRPMVTPSNLRILPKDLGFTLTWDAMIDADGYAVELEFPPGEWTVLALVAQPPDTRRPSYDSPKLKVGMQRRVRIVAKNDYGDSDPSEALTFVAMRNLALVKGATPPSEYVCTSPSPPIRNMNNQRYDDSNDSRNGGLKNEDYWGYMWSGALYFEHVAYFSGEIDYDGGWFTDLTVEYTEDGITWKKAPSVQITPPYCLSDGPAGRDDFVRYDIAFPVLRGTGIRIFGAPGGLATFTSISELEVYGDQTRGPLVVQGLDAGVLEKSTTFLDGSYSFSVRGPILSYEWEQLSGPSVLIRNASAAIASFDSPAVDKDTVLVFSLTAGDGVELRSDDEVSITIKNLGLVAHGGPDQVALEGSEVTLKVAAPSWLGTCQWGQVAGPPVSLVNPESPVCAFTAPVIWSFIERLTFQLQMNDGIGDIGTDDVHVDIVNSAFDVRPLGSGYFREFLHLGQTPEDRFLAPLNESLDANDYLAKWGGQANVNPVQGDEHIFTGTEIQTTSGRMIWTPIGSDDGFFGKEPFDHFGQIYHIYVLSPEERKARLHFRNDDEIRIWNNGVVAVSRDGWDGGSEQYEDFILDKGVNSMTLRFEEREGGSHIAARITDGIDVPYDDILYALSLPNPLPTAYAMRGLPNSYEPGTTVHVQLSVRADPDNLPDTITVSERIPAGLSAADAGGGQMIDGVINWHLSNLYRGIGTISYTLDVPAGIPGPLEFEGTVDCAVSAQEIWGDSTVYEAPSGPTNLIAEMLLAGHLSWNPSAEAGVSGYRIYRNANAEGWEEIAFVTVTFYVDDSVLEGESYNYAVSAVNAAGVESPRSQPTGEKTIAMETRQAEHFNYGGGLYPWIEGTTVPANEAPSADAVESRYDFWHPNKGGPRQYRPLDDIGVETVEDADKPGQFTTYVGWTDPGSWWKYTFNVPEAGWIKLSFRVASRNGGTLAAYWDQQRVGTVFFRTGHEHIFTYVPMEGQTWTTAGEHVLRIELVSGLLSFDKIGLGYNWSPPTRLTIWEDDFESYYNLFVYDDLVAGGWSVVNGSRIPDVAWRLWNDDDIICVAPPCGPSDGMTHNYVITNSDLVANAILDEELITPEIDCTNYVKVRLDFSKNFRIYRDNVDHLQIAEVDIRAYDEAGDGWGDWINLLRFDRTTLAPAEEDGSPEEVDVAHHADGKKILVRWHFYDAQFDYWFAVDNVRVSGVLAGPPQVTKLLKTANVVSLTWEAFGSGKYAVEFVDDLVDGLWQSVSGERPITGTSWTGDDISEISKRYYRVTLWH